MLRDRFPVSYAPTTATIQADLHRRTTLLTVTPGSPDLPVDMVRLPCWQFLLSFLRSICFDTVESLLNLTSGHYERHFVYNMIQ